ALPESQGMTTMSKFDQTSRLRERHSPDKRDDVPPQTCPVRLVVGFQRILLLVENWPGVGWYVLDSYSLADETDRDLLTGVRELKTVGYTFGRGKYRVKAGLAPAMFSPAGAEDLQCKTVMARLARHGLPTSNEIIRIDDPHFETLADGWRECQRRRRAKNRR